MSRPVSSSRASHSNTFASPRDSIHHPAPVYQKNVSRTEDGSAPSTPRNIPKNFSSFPVNSNRLTRTDVDEGSRYRAMIKYLHSKVISNQWHDVQRPDQLLGVLLRRQRGEYVTGPSDINPTLLQAVIKMNVEVAITMSTETTSVIFTLLKPEDTEIMLADGSQLQIVNSLAEIVRGGSAKVRKFQYGALVRQEQLLIIWHDDLEQIILQASNVEEKLLGLLWGSSATPFAFMSKFNTPNTGSPIPSVYGNSMNDLQGATESIAPIYGESELHLEDQVEGSESLARPVVFTSTIITALSVLFIIFLVVGLGTSNLVFETWADHQWMRWALVATEPFIFIMSMFFAICVFTDLFQILGPITSLSMNSRFFSAKKPSLKAAYSTGFRPPKVTIQMPVYKESLQGVIIPTVKSLKAAISHYESRGGTASIFINDDGLAYLNEEDAQARIDFYHDNNIGWVSRPKHEENVFVRKGKFKKASNMNFGLNVSMRVERLLQEMIENSTGSQKGNGNWITTEEEEELYSKALSQVLASDSTVRAAGNICVGEIILIVDSDTQVPEDCLLYGAAEMYLSPEVAIIQHSTGVMQVSWDYFENGIAFFTRMVYTAIRFSVSNGEVAPFVGHNAFLRWKAMQSVGKAEDDGYVAFWSESHVSEDFDMAIRLQIAGNTVRLASYHNDEFKEGVSLTIYDELARWEKYAYGCNELVFNPIYTWLWRGPFAKLFLTFVGSNIHLSSKITILAYITSYYAIASSFPFTIANYFLVGWIPEYLDKFYMRSWNVFLTVVLLFCFVSNFCLAVLRYRTGEKALFSSLIENYKWLPMFAIFFGGLSFHLNLAILAHMFGINMQWGATSKEKENSNFFKEVPKIAKSFKWMYIVLLPLIGGMIYLGCFAPRGWEINQMVAVLPLGVMVGSHALAPFVLNPSIMVFNY